VAFTVDPGWHLYANSRNDSGLPISVDLHGPEGYSIGALQWPAPHREVSPGAILDHVYKEQVLLLLPVQVPPDARPGTTARFAGTVDWLVCGTGCIPGNASLSLELPIAPAGDAAIPSPDAAAFAAARRRLPVAPEGGEVSARWADGSLSLEVAGATKLAFYPDTGCVALLDPIADGEAQGGALALRIDSTDGRPAVRGVLEVWHGDRSDCFLIDSSRPREESSANERSDPRAPLDNAPRGPQPHTQGGTKG
jgi:thiol:disulfide interchange protein DsbD